MKLQFCWQPILKGASAKKAWRFIEQLDGRLYTLEKKYRGEPSLHLFNGGFGAALFCYYLYRYSGERQYLNRGKSFLYQASQAAEQMPVSDRLFSGLTGTAWLYEHFRGQPKGKFTKWPKGTDPNGEVDNYLSSKIRDAINSKTPLGGYGLTEDWIGYGVYALERWPNDKSSRIISSLVKFLNERAKRKPEGVAWFTPKISIPIQKKNEYVSGNYNLGVAHGIPGVIGFLSGALKREIETELTRDLLENSIKWLLAQDKNGHFGHETPMESRKSKFRIPPRLAWCYGDLGISIVLLNASKVLENKTFEDKALAMAKRAAKFSRSKSGIVNPHFCHGASGVFHIFNRLYQNTGEIIFLETAKKWALEVFKKVEQDNETGRAFNVLTGETGIGLSLLCGVTDIPPDWDRLLLLSSI